MCWTCYNPSNGSGSGAAVILLQKLHQPLFNYVLLVALKVLTQCWFIQRKQCGQTVWTLDLKSGGPGFKSRSEHYLQLELFHGRPEFNSPATLINSQLACLLSAGIFNPVMFILKYVFLIFECSTPLAPCYNHLPRVNNGHLLFNPSDFAQTSLCLFMHCSQCIFIKQQRIN